MHGVGQAFGAITFVNALPTGIGVAAAIGLQVRAVATLEHREGVASRRLEIAEAQRTPLVEASTRRALELFPPKEPSGVSLELDSAIPQGRGLKSSSAVSGAVLAAVAHASGGQPDSHELARWSADLSQEIGLSATGAFDDAFAAIAGGCAITDNRTRQVLQRPTLATDLEVILWIPEGTHLPSVAWRDRFLAREDEGQSAVDAAVSGDLFEAMRRNTALVEDVMGYRYRDLRESLEDAGAIVSGVSGLGPTLAVLVPQGGARPVLDSLPRDRAEVRTVRLEPPRKEGEVMA
jgi:shikimate kinase